MLEKKVERHLVIKVKTLLKGKCYKFVSPGNNGVPDRIVLLPGGKMCFVETKQLDGQMRALQMLRRDEIRELGHEVYVAYTIEEVNALINLLHASLKGL